MSLEKKPTLSIIIPVYNSGNYLNECIDSVINFINPHNTELIVINDCSTDNSKEIIEHYKSKYPMLNVIENETNQGLSETRNIGVNYSTGDYIVFLDSDDLLLLPEVYKLLEFSILNDYDILEFKYSKFEGLVNLCKESDFLQEIIGIEYLDGKKALTSLLKSNKFETVAWNKIYKVQLIKESGLSFIKNRYAEDIDWTPKIFAMAKKVYITINRAYFYRFTINSITNSTEIRLIEKRQKDIIDTAMMNMKHFSHESKELRNQIYDWYSRSIMFAATLNPSTYDHSKLLPLLYSKRFSTIIKSLIFAFSINLYKAFKESQKKHDKNPIH